MLGRSILKDIISMFIRQETQKNLGRWNIDYCNKIIHMKIDFANKDNSY